MPERCSRELIFRLSLHCANIVVQHRNVWDEGILNFRHSPPPPPSLIVLVGLHEMMMIYKALKQIQDHLTRLQTMRSTSMCKRRAQSTAVGICTPQAQRVIGTLCGNDYERGNNKIKMIQNVRHRVCFATEIMGTAIVLNPHRSHAPRQGAMLQIIHYADVKQHQANLKK